MDELIAFMEADLKATMEKSEGGQEGPSTSAPTPSETPVEVPVSQPKKKEKVTFNSIFGSPDKRDLSDLGLRQKMRVDGKVPHKPEVGVLPVIDPYSRIRLVKKSISIYFDESMTAEQALKDRNIGLEFVGLGGFQQWYRGKGKDQKNFWVSGVLVSKTSGRGRQSAKGNDYHVWELSDLRDLGTKTTVFLFGSAVNGIGGGGGPAVGSLIDVTTPGVMEGEKGVKLSVKGDQQVRWIGEAKDFGFCGAKKKDGQPCTMVVNKWECSFCGHHAAGELRKMNGGKGEGKEKKKNGWGGGGGGGGVAGTGSFGEGFRPQSQESLKQEGVFIANYGGGATGSGAFSGGGGGGSGGGGFGGRRSLGGGGQAVKVTSRPNLPQSSRMALQGGVNQMGKNPIKFGNPESVTFKQDGDNEFLKKEGVKGVKEERKPLNLDPSKTRHLSDKDRELLSKLEMMNKEDEKEKKGEEEEGKGKKKIKCAGGGLGGREVPKVSDVIAENIVSRPNAASRNFLQFLNLKSAPKEQLDSRGSKIQPMTLNRAKLESMAKALNFVKSNGPLKKEDPNSVKKRKMEGGGSLTALGAKRKKVENKDGEVDKEEFEKILKAKSAHDEELDGIKEKEYFEHLEKKEQLENKLLNTFSLETNAVMCRQCKYVALSQGDFCKEQQHHVRLVKARKRFFKCKDCGNRTMALDRLPNRPCTNCGNSSWLAAPVGKERKGPTLPSEMLSVRGNEEKFIGSAGSKMFLHLNV